MRDRDVSRADDEAYAARITFVRLTEVALADVVTLLNERRNARHMPLARAFTDEETADWVRAKDAQWDEHGYGPWAIVVDGEFAGWGGFQHDAGVPDYALVLHPRHWGIGAAVTRLALDRGFAELGLDEVVIALPRSRTPDRVVARLGFRPDGDVTYDGATFRRFRLDRQDWIDHRAG